MREKIDCFLPCDDIIVIEELLDVLRQDKTIHHIHLLVSEEFSKKHTAPRDCSYLVVNNLTSTQTVLAIEQDVEADYVLWSMKTTPVRLGLYALDRLLRTACDTDAAMVYSDRYETRAGENGMTAHPTIDYQTGSIRDDFDFGQLIVVKSELLHAFAAQATLGDYQYAGIYDLRLFLSRNGKLFHINESLYTEVELDTRKSGEKQFDYVNPRNRDVQVEMEQAATAHLDAIGAKVDTTTYEDVDINEQNF